MAKQYDGKYQPDEVPLKKVLNHKKDFFKPIQRKTVKTYNVTMAKKP